MRSIRGTSILAGLALACAGLAAGSAAAQAPAAPLPSTLWPAIPVTYTMEQIRTGPMAADVQQKIAPLNTMTEVEALLKANRIEFVWRIAELKSDTMPPDLARQIAALKPNEVFLVPTPQAVVIGTVIARH
jgi:hypothetical protein